MCLDNNKKQFIIMSGNIICSSALASVWSSIRAQQCDICYCETLWLWPQST